MYIRLPLSEAVWFFAGLYDGVPMRIIAIATLLFLSSCANGVIDCPVPQEVRLKKSPNSKRLFRLPARDLTARAEETPSKQKKYQAPPKRIPPLKHVDVEEWDCPRPGVKRELPKEIKQNIRKNSRRLKTHYKAKADSLQTSR